jgi:hypothetical protein
LTDESVQQNVVEQLLSEWNALRVTEAYRRRNFTTLRDEALARWNARGPHNDSDQHFIEHRMSRGAQALAEALEMEERSDVMYASCVEDFDSVSSLDEKYRQKMLSKIQSVCQRAINEGMRYRTTVVSTFQYEVKELIEFVEERLREIDAAG